MRSFCRFTDVRRIAALAPRDPPVLHGADAGAARGVRTPLVRLHGRLYQNKGNHAKTCPLLATVLETCDGETQNVLQSVTGTFLSKLRLIHTELLFMPRSSWVQCISIGHAQYELILNVGVR